MTRSTVLSLALVTSLVAGCNRDDAAEPTRSEAPTQEPAPTLVEVDVPDLERMLESSEAVAVDANNPGTRERFGVIPDARMLSSSSSYDLGELPADKSTTLVFYCANTSCTASDAAAMRASAGGYEDVRVLRAGISGWRDAGKPTVPTRS
jgi:rhodanese-related sulfurtransferase